MMNFWILCTAEFFIFCCLFTMIVHIVPYANDRGLQPTTAAAVLSTIGGISMLGRIVMGTANDRIGGKRSLVIALILLITSLIWLQMAASAWMLFIFALIYGFAHGAFFTVMSPMVAEFFGTGSHGSIFGMVWFSGTLGGSAGPLLAGYIYDLTGTYRADFIILTLTSFMALLLVSRLRTVAIANSP
jgi:MFS family permease